MSGEVGTIRGAGFQTGRINDALLLQVALPPEFFEAVRRCKRRLTNHVLVVSILDQRMRHFQLAGRAGTPLPATSASDNPKRPYRLQREFIVSTSRFGIGQKEGSNKTPLGLHRIARKIGAGRPVGTVFKGRKPIGTIAEIGREKAMICHRILWLEGLEPGFNRGGKVDTFSRYIYIHGFGDETTLGKPQSHGCIHVGAKNLIPLYAAVPRGALVWIQR